MFTDNHRIRVLVLAADPRETDRSRLGAEVREIQAKIRGARYRDSLDLISRWAVRPDDLQQALLEVEPHIVHFIGHRTREEAILLEDESGGAQPVDKAALGELFRILKDNVRIVVLNACYSRPQAEAIIRHIDCAIGMPRAIAEDAAIEFAASFYQAVAFGRSIREAFELGKNALKLKGISGANIPDLLLRRGVGAERVILVTPSGVPGDRRPEHPSSPYESTAKASAAVLSEPRGGAPSGRYARIPVALVLLALGLVGASVGRRRVAGFGEANLSPVATAGAALTADAATEIPTRVVLPPGRGGTATSDPLQRKPLSAPDVTRASATDLGPSTSKPATEVPGAAAIAVAPATLPPPSSADKTVVRTGDLKAGAGGKIRAGNRAGGGAVDVETKKITTGDDGRVDVGNVARPAASDAGTSIRVKTGDVQVGDGGTIDIGNVK